MTVPPLCKDCRHCRPNWWEPFDRFEFAKCHAPQDLKIDLVSGKLIPVHEPNYCSSQRFFEGASNCGPSGRWFEARK